MPSYSTSSPLPSLFQCSLYHVMLHHTVLHCTSLTHQCAHWLIYLHVKTVPPFILLNVCTYNKWNRLSCDRVLHVILAAAINGNIVVVGDGGVTSHVGCYDSSKPLWLFIAYRSFSFSCSIVSYWGSFKRFMHVAAEGSRAADDPIQREERRGEVSLRWEEVWLW